MTVAKERLKKGLWALLSTEFRKHRECIISFDFVGPQEVINIYILSIATADLICGLLVVPLSVYPAMVQRWIYGDIVCRLAGYIEVRNHSNPRRASNVICSCNIMIFFLGDPMGRDNIFIYVDECG